VARVVVSNLIIDDSIEAKIRAKRPPLTGAEVREVVLWSRDAVTRWDTKPEHGRRLVVVGTTFLGRRLVAYLMPVDERESVYKLKTARALKP
jgi:hypothetical protein